MTPTRRALVLVAAGTVLAALPVLVGAAWWTLWIFFWCLLAVAALADVALVPARGHIIYSLALPDALYLGAPTPMTLVLGFGVRRTARALFLLDTSEHLAPIPREAVTVSGTPTHVIIPLRAVRRGLARVDALWLRYPGPLGLIARTVRIPLDVGLDAVPNLRAVRLGGLQFESRHGARQGLRIERFNGDGSEFDSLRDFQPGMDRRGIDWKASARHRQLFARQYRAERSRQIVIAIDTGRLMGEPLDGLPRVDHAIHAGLLLAYISARGGDRVGFFGFDAAPHSFTQPRAGSAAFRSLLKLTGAMEYSSEETNFTLGLTHLMGRLTRRSLVVVLTDFVDTVTAELMVDNVGHLAGRHLVVFVALRDPALGRLSTVLPDSLQRLNIAVVADAMLRERELVLARLRSAGVFCIDASPSEVGVELVNRYLTVKRRELI